MAALATFLNIIPLIPALIFYFAFGPRGPRIGAQSKENLNWTINVTGILVLANLLDGVLGWIPLLGILVHVVLYLVTIVVVVLNIVFSIMGGIKANQGQFYAYPFNIRWIR